MFEQKNEIVYYVFRFSQHRALLSVVLQLVKYTHQKIISPMTRRVLFF